MTELIRLLFTVASFTFLSRYVGDKPISAALVLCVFIAAGHVLYGTREPTSALRWRRPFWLFLILGLVSLVLSQFAAAALTKGLTQCAGLIIVILTASAIVRQLRRHPAEMIVLAQRATRAVGILAGIGVAQFVLANMFMLRELASFGFLNDLAGGPVWRNPDFVGPLMRANSLCREPAHFCLFLGLGSGIAVIRVGLLGRALQTAIAPIVSLRAATLILTGFVVSLSVLGFLQLLVVVGLCWVSCRRLAIRAVFSLAVRLALVAAIILFVANQTGSVFFEKVSTLAFIADPELAAQERAVSASAVTFAIQVEVVASHLPQNPLLGIGFGAHPVAYEAFAPAWSESLDGIWMINADDAASLLLRLVSETGILGTLTFLMGAVLIFVRARSAVIRTLDAGVEKRHPPTLLLATTIGMTGAMGSVVFIFLARYAVYYEPLLWMLFAVVASVPFLLEHAYDPAGSTEPAPDLVGLPVSIPAA